MAAPNERELQLLEQFRERIQDLIPRFSEYEKSDICLLRWIRARDQNLHKAEEMIRKTVEYVEQNRESLTSEPSAHYRRTVPWYMTGFSDKGNPVLILPFGTWDLKAIVKMGEQEPITRYSQACFAELLRLMDERSRCPDQVISQFVVILDFEGYSMSQLTSLGVIELSLQLLKQFESNCPEMLEAAYVVNASSLFTALFSIVKPFLTSRTLSKVKVYGSDQGRWKKVLLEALPQGCLPKKFGGTASDLGQSHLGLIPNGTANDDGLENQNETVFSQITVSPGKKLQVQSEINVPNSVLMWAFRVEQCDIGFRVIYENKDESFSYRKCTAGHKCYEGSVVCDKPGNYSLEFDNSYSLLRSKVLRYSVNVISPQDVSG